jgi:hypothetical protein
MRVLKKNKERQNKFVSEIYRLELLEKIDMTTWEQKTITLKDGIWEWSVTKNIWEYDRDKPDRLIEIRISCCNSDWVKEQNFSVSVHNKLFCQRSCWVYKDVGTKYEKSDSIWKDGLVFQGICMKY